jgi:transposase
LFPVPKPALPRFASAGCIDAALRSFGAAPPYLLTDNERVVTTDRLAGLAVRHPVMVSAGRHYGLEPSL